ncbi:MAG: branched-chain amino acid transport system substrate-binding protein [Chloroflexota bacterium]|jgi:ABC-type branched-subunit amino acid transport system substrate-binding protein|nr:branched-chain amino acid transport system substrate-binding protein [Chloroflexota bacterium]
MRGAPRLTLSTLLVALVATFASLAPVPAAAEEVATAVDRQAYVSSSEPVDPYNHDAIGTHVSWAADTPLTPGGPAAWSFYHVDLSSLPSGAEVTSVKLTLKYFLASDSPHASEPEINNTSSILYGCMLTDELKPAAEYSYSAPPKIDCTKGSITGTRDDTDGSFSFELLPLVSSWLHGTNTGVAILPLPGSPNSAYSVTFDNSLTGAAAVFTPAPTSAGGGRTVVVQNPQPAVAPVPGLGSNTTQPAAPVTEGSPAAPAATPAPKVTVPQAPAPAAGPTPTGPFGVPWWALALATSGLLALVLLFVPLRRAIFSAGGSLGGGVLRQLPAHGPAVAVAAVAVTWSVAFTGYSFAYPNAPLLGGGEQAASDLPGDELAPEATPSAETPGAAGNPTPSATSGPGTLKKIGNTTVFVPEGGGPPVANLFSAAQDRVGISDSNINLCAHAALTYANAFQTTEDDFNVFWTNLNAHGGIHGRTVTQTYKNDNYEPTTAIQAAQQCKDTQGGIFFLEGGIGFDQIPQVRVWAERNRMLYLHHVATEQGGEGSYSFAPLPSVEMMGRFFGELVTKKHHGQNTGVIWRGSDTWQPGRDVFEQVLAADGTPVTGDFPVTKNQGSYANEINALSGHNGGPKADVVFIWENALAVPQIIAQAHSQAYFPTFVVFPFNLETQTLTQADVNPAIEGVAVWPAYTKGQYGGPFASYADDIHEFEREYAEYRPNTDLGGKGGDLLFLNWVAQKATAQMLEDCGRDCTRNKVAGMMLSGYQKTVTPNCPGDWSRRSHYGSYGMTIFETYNLGTGVAWRPQALCVEHP